MVAYEVETRANVRVVSSVPSNNHARDVKLDKFRMSAIVYGTELVLLSISSWSSLYHINVNWSEDSEHPCQLSTETIGWFLVCALPINCWLFQLTVAKRLNSFVHSDIEHHINPAQRALLSRWATLRGRLYKYSCTLHYHHRRNYHHHRRHHNHHRSHHYLRLLNLYSFKWVGQ